MCFFNIHTGLLILKRENLVFHHNILIGPGLDQEALKSASRLDLFRSMGIHLKEIDQVFRALARNPMMGRGCDEVRVGYRKLAHGSHVIYYKQPEADFVLVVRILHATMDVDSQIGG